MSEIWPETIQWCLSMLKYIGFQIEKDVSNPHANVDDYELWKDLYIMWSAKVGDPYPQHLFFAKSPDMNKQKFLKLFSGGHSFSNVVGSIPWTGVGSVGSDVRFERNARKLKYDASFFGDVGRGNNNQVYLDTGWIAAYEEGNYSNMALIEFEMESGMNVGGSSTVAEMVITYGEDAYSQWIQKSEKVIIPNSINNWAI
tara:strand:+ start:359 stop:955 length:597 start_codon:yes stop_codon:yes gene_type:complete